MRRDKIFYSLNIEDIQNVAIDIIGRLLTKEEIEKIIPSIEVKISWYCAIADSIRETINRDNKF